MIFCRFVFARSFVSYVDSVSFSRLKRISSRQVSCRIVFFFRWLCVRDFLDASCCCCCCCRNTEPRRLNSSEIVMWAHIHESSALLFLLALLAVNRLVCCRSRLTIKKFCWRRDHYFEIMYRHLKQQWFYSSKKLKHVPESWIINLSKATFPIRLKSDSNAFEGGRAIEILWKDPDKSHQISWFSLMWKGELNSYRSKWRFFFSLLSVPRKIPIFFFRNNMKTYIATFLHTTTLKDMKKSPISNWCEWAKARERTWRKKKTRMQHKTKNTIVEKSYSWNSSRQVNICLSASHSLAQRKNSIHKYIKYFSVCVHCFVCRLILVSCAFREERKLWL